MKNTIETYWSCDLETDGTIPGKYSISSIGFCVAGWRGEEGFRSSDLNNPIGIYKELKPISDNYEPEALEVTGFNREQLKQTGEDPREALEEINDFIESNSEGKPVFVAYPLAFDWMFYYWYTQNFLESFSPFGFSGGIDIKTLYSGITGEPLKRSGLSHWPEDLAETPFPHTHNALDDAIQQASVFQNLMNEKF